VNSDKLAENKDFQKWCDENILYLVNEVAETFFANDDINSYDRLHLATVRSITAEDIEDFRQGYDPTDMPDMEDPDFRDQLIEHKQQDIMQYYLISDHLAHWLQEVGEIVLEDMLGLTVWCKRSFGQSYHYEYALQEAYRRLQKLRDRGPSIFELEQSGECF
tara:strand:- start:727 stop:1212 length:486 start_codon:yes stop_codon:yes gene_type:complete